ncbi:hypothetical protein LG634_24620 [Streptomyces bambusae]|uniref:hypothetical protein n=1 Tax=Streptomyces bambusae TaxID=1550616 RepID=UPI001CFC8299|nr:hypothetical protein [Streptomyces bambusae]MCB5167998.1 hypothetical protein [Streptomyces bambusae]
MLIPSALLVHQATVEPYLGTGPSGPKYGPAFTIKCLAQDKTRLVRSPEGDEITSTATVYTRLGPTVPVKSRVTLPAGRRTTVIESRRHDGGTLPTPNHLELRLL